MNVFESLKKSGAELNSVVYNTVLDVAQLIWSRALGALVSDGCQEVLRPLARLKRNSRELVGQVPSSCSHSVEKTCPSPLSLMDQLLAARHAWNAASWRRPRLG